jgi:methionyl-tRNA formyltransferase
MGMHAEGGMVPQRPLSILLVAEEAAGVQVLRHLATREHRIVAVMSRGQSSHKSATVADVAQTLGCPLWTPTLVKSSDFANLMREKDVDLLLNVHSLFIIHPDVVSAPRIGSFNLHPGPLPKYAGLNAPSWAIYFGEQEHSVTLHWMLAGVDTGPIAYEATFDITEHDTGLSLSTKCVRHGVPLVARLLEAATVGAHRIPALEQDITQRRYFSRQRPLEGRILWSLPGRRIVNFIRACDYGPFPSPWLHPKARLDKEVVEITKASLTGKPCPAPPGSVGWSEGTSVAVATADEWILIRSLRKDGRTFKAAEVLETGDLLDDGAPG